MKKTSKRKKFAKILATFLGASATLIPIAALVSCEQTAKTPVVKEEKKQKLQDPPPPNPQNPKKPGNGGEQKPGNEGGHEPGTEQPGTEQPGTGQPGTEQHTIIDTDGNEITIIEPTGTNKDAPISLKGSIRIDEFDKLKEKLKEYSGKSFETSDLNFNCFKKEKAETTNTQSYRTLRIMGGNETTESSTRQVAIEITPTLLRELSNFKESKLSTKIRLNNKTDDGKIIEVPFLSNKEEKPSDIFDLKDFIEIIDNFESNKEFKLSDNSKIFIQSKVTKHMEGTRDIASYPKIETLLQLLEKFGKTLSIINNMYVVGNVKGILPYLVGQNKIDETYGKIRFLNREEALCSGPNGTRYDGGENNTEHLPLEQFLEFRKRTDVYHNNTINEDTHPLDINNLILKKIDTTKINDEDIDLLRFKNGDVFGGKLVFIDCNLSKIPNMRTSGPVDVIFKDTTLPISMGTANMTTLTLKNVKYPKKEFENYEIPLSDLPLFLPTIEESLTIEGDIGNSLLKSATFQQLEDLKQVTKKIKMPAEYNESNTTENIYNRLKYIFKGEAKTINGNPNPNYTEPISSINKNKDQYLALLKQRNDKVHA